MLNTKGVFVTFHMSIIETQDCTVIDTNAQPKI